MEREGGLNKTVGGAREGAGGVRGCRARARGRLGTEWALASQSLWVGTPTSGRGVGMAHPPR